MKNEKMKNKESGGSVLITGASGFIGSFLVEEAVRRGFDTWAGVRATSSRAYLQDPRIHFLELDFGKPDVLRRQLAGHGRFDYIVHCAGVTKCIDPADFERMNHRQTCDFIDALRELELVPRQFIFISTLSVFGPVHERTYEPICDSDTPCPDTAYGRSKLKTEQYLQRLEGFPYVVFLAIGKGVARRAYFLSDGQVYSSRTFSDLLIREMGNPWVIRLKLPLFALKIVSLCAEWWAKRRKKASTLNRDKYHIMKQRNWRCDTGPAVRELGYAPAYDLDRGVRLTVAWYKENGWL